MKLVERILNYKRDEFKERRYMYYSNDAMETLRWQEYILKGKLSFQDYRKNI